MEPPPSISLYGAILRLNYWSKSAANKVPLLQLLCSKIAKKNVKSTTTEAGEK